MPPAVRGRVNPAALEGLRRRPETRRFTLYLARIGAEGAKRRAPYDTNRRPGDENRPHLRDTITFWADGDSAFYGGTVDYEFYQEFGTRFQAGTPHIRPALDDIRIELRRQR